MKLKNMLMIGIAAAALPVGTINTQAQERFKVWGMDTNNPATVNTALTSSSLATITNSTGSATITVWGTAFYIGDWQYTQPSLFLSVLPGTSVLSGTNGVATATLDLSPEGTLWWTNAVSISATLNGTNSPGWNLTTPAQTNWYGYRYARWGQFTTTQTNTTTTVQQFKAQVYR